MYIYIYIYKIYIYIYIYTYIKYIHIHIYIARVWPKSINFLNPFLCGWVCVHISMSKCDCTRHLRLAACNVSFS